MCKVTTSLFSAKFQFEDETCTVSRKGTGLLSRVILNSWDHFKGNPSRFVKVEVSDRNALYFKKSELSQKLHIFPPKETISLSKIEERRKHENVHSPLVIVAQNALRRIKRNHIIERTGMSQTEYKAYARFAKSHRDEWAKLPPDSEPIRYTRKESGTLRSVTYVPGQGLMIHMKGRKRDLTRVQLGKKGAQGVVTQAVCFETGAVVAFKSMKLINCGKEQTINKELHALLKQHPDRFASGHVVSYKEKEGLFMPVMAGGELFDKAKAGIEKEKLASYFLQVAESVQLLHEYGYLHRDLKLDNFLLSKDKTRVVLADFDMAGKIGENNWKLGSGNLDHMAPETYGEWLQNQFHENQLDNLTYSQFTHRFNTGFRIDHFFSMLGSDAKKDRPLTEQFQEKFGNGPTTKSEVFSVGILLFEMKTRKKFEYPVYTKYLNNTDPLDKIILSCLALHPNDRPTLKYVIDELEKIKEQSPK